MAISKKTALADGVINGSMIIDSCETKIDFEDHIGETLTVTDFEKVITKKGDAYVITFKELKKSYAWAGGWLKKFIDKYGDEFKGTKIIVGEKVKTSDGNDFRQFELAE